MPSAVYFTPSAPHASILSVWLFGAGPGSNLDLAAFIFQVPIFESAAIALMPMASTPAMTNALVRKCLVIMCPPGSG